MLVNICLICSFSAPNLKRLQTFQVPVSKSILYHLFHLSTFSFSGTAPGFETVEFYLVTMTPSCPTLDLRATVSLFVCQLTQNMSSIVVPTSSNGAASMALEFTHACKLPHQAK
jgi:hypothetical protein